MYYVVNGEGFGCAEAVIVSNSKYFSVFVHSLTIKGFF